MATMENTLMQLKEYLEGEFTESASIEPKNLAAVMLMGLLLEDIKELLLGQGGVHGQFVTIAPGTAIPFTLDSPFVIDNHVLSEEAGRKFQWGNQINIVEVIGRCAEMNMLHQRFDGSYQLSPHTQPWNICYENPYA